MSLFLLNGSACTPQERDHEYLYHLVATLGHGTAVNRSWRWVWFLCGVCTGMLRLPHGSTGTQQGCPCHHMVTLGHGKNKHTQATQLVQKRRSGFYLSCRMLVHRLTLVRAKSRMGGVCSLALPSRASDIVIGQREEGEVESGMNWFHRALVQSGITGCVPALRKGIKRLQRPAQGRRSESWIPRRGCETGSQCSNVSLCEQREPGQAGGSNVQ